jgi:EAL domain-containing protein (putative c-di-GMP-specific phosphodiesterase class I)
MPLAVQFDEYGDAEGVEDSEQLVWLRRVGCDFVPGYLISPPMSASALGDLLHCNAPVVTTTA